jgi:hypothetical protein
MRYEMLCPPKPFFAIPESFESEKAKEGEM